MRLNNKCRVCTHPQRLGKGCLRSRLHMRHMSLPSIDSLTGLVCVQVQGGKPKARRALKSEDSLSVSATDSEADSMMTDSGVAKRKPGAKKGAPLASQLSTAYTMCCGVFCMLGM